MRTKFLLLIFGLLAIITIQAQTFNEGDFAYTVIEGTTNVKVKAINPTMLPATIDIPKKIEYENVAYTVTEVEDQGFYNCSNIKSIFLPVSLVTIGEEAFMKCDGLWGLYLGHSLKLIKNKAFYDCSRLNYISTNAMAAPILEGEVFYNLSQSVYLLCRIGAIGYESSENGWPAKPRYIDNQTNLLYEIIKGTQTDLIIVGDYRHTDLPEDLIIPEFYMFEETKYTVKKTDAYVFRLCGIKSITFPDSFEELGMWTFYENKIIENIYLGNSLKIISNNAFTDIRIKKITIPKSVEKILYAAFAACYNLKDVTVEWMQPISIEPDVFMATNIGVSTLHVPIGTKNLYEETPVWQDFGQIVEYIPAGMEDNNKATDITIYPNPTSEYFVIENVEETALAIYDTYGRLVYSKQTVSASETINCSEWTKGIYYITITGNNKRIVKKIIKE